MVRIAIESLRVPVKVGCTAEERSYPQILLFDIEIHLSSVKSCTTDSVTDTVDYVKLADEIGAYCGDGSWHLLEKLAADLGAHLRVRFPLITEGEIKISKNVIAAASKVVVTINFS